MNRIQALFDRQPRDLLNVYFTAGYPQLHDTGRLIRSLSANGVDLIEIGMPYSDPLADGTTIQESSLQALRNGMTLDLLFDQIAEARPHTDAPLILMGYFNPVMQYGERRFLERCKAVGVDGLILPDLPLHEYEAHYRPMFEELELGISFLITPQTTEARIREVDALTRGFIYMVSSAAITGAQSGISPAQVAYFERIVAMQLTQPRLIGFGISDRATYETACRHASGAIIGSAFIRALGAGTEDVEATVATFVKGLR